MYSMKGATRARDHIYALGFASDAEGAALDADYNDTLEAVFTRYASFFIQRDKSVTVLLQAGSDKAPTRFPSWVTDWTVYKNKLRDSETAPDSDKHQAGGNSTVQARLGNDPRILILKGGLIDVIIKVGEDHTLGSGDKGAIRALHPLVNHFETQTRCWEHSLRIQLEKNSQRSIGRP